jgi:hypothetical protein
VTGGLKEYFLKLYDLFTPCDRTDLMGRRFFRKKKGLSAE